MRRRTKWGEENSSFVHWDADKFFDAVCASGSGEGLLYAYFTSLKAVADAVSADSDASVSAQLKTIAGTSDSAALPLVHRHVRLLTAEQYRTQLLALSGDHGVVG